MAEQKTDKRDDAGLQVEQQTSDEFTTPIPPAQSNKPPVWMWFGLGGLLILALVVIFVLPTVVSEYELPLERRVEVATPESARSPREPGNTISPFEEAQRARQRSEAQDVLAELLEIQDELESLEVSTWAAQAYQSAIAAAGTGDEYYRNQEFGRATESYIDARNQLASLRDRVPEAFEAALTEADAALAVGDAGLAEDKYSLALLLKPESEAADIGLQRARTLDEVNALFEQAETLVEDNEFAEARELYASILDLDSYNERARQAVDTMTERIREAEFGRIMSEGYALLEQQDPEAAIAAFQRAANLGVNPEQAQAAIVQTETAVANARINALREQINEAEAGEQWQTAVDHYDAVLEIDPNVTFASQGRRYAAQRAQLDRLLVEAIDNPERFADDAVYQETLDVYYTGRSLENPGPRLQQQLDELEKLLEVSQVPVEVTFRSDNLTRVTLLREGELGNFEQRSLSLKPGRYVAVGSRPGYREVRKEFVVGYGQTPDVVVVECEERVPGGSR